MAVGFASSLLFKTKLLRTDDRHSPLEANIVILFAFASYFIADGLSESGIVAVLFCGMVSSITQLSLPVLWHGHLAGRFVFRLCVVGLNLVEFCADCVFLYLALKETLPSAQLPTNELWWEWCLADDGKLYAAQFITVRTGDVHGLLSHLGHHGTLPAIPMCRPFHYPQLYLHNRRNNRTIAMT